MVGGSQMGIVDLANPVGAAEIYPPPQLWPPSESRLSYFESSESSLFLRRRMKAPLWLAWADYLILSSVALAVFGATVPLLVLPSLQIRDCSCCGKSGRGGLEFVGRVCPIYFLLTIASSLVPIELARATKGSL
jgi:hypothetical protein